MAAAVPIMAATSTAVQIDAAARDAWLHTYVLPLMPNLPTVFILRGVSGSGKSSITGALTANLPRHFYRICSADDHFRLRAGAQLDPNQHVVGGGYAFDPAELPIAHAYCHTRFNAALSERVPVIFVDNTNTTLREYADYISALIAFNEHVMAGAAPGAAPLIAGPVPTLQAPRGGFPYALYVLEIECADRAMLEYFSSRNSHGVDMNVSVKQWMRFQHDQHAVLLPGFIPPSAHAWFTLRRAELVAQAAAPPGTVHVTATPPPPTIIPPPLPTTARIPPQVLSSPTATAVERVTRGIAKLSQHCRLVGLFLYPSSRAALLAACPPRFKQVMADHVTLAFGPKVTWISPALIHSVGTPVELRITGEFASEHVQAAEVQWLMAPASESAGGSSRDASDDSGVTLTDEGAAAEDETDADNMSDSGSGPHDAIAGSEEVVGGDAHVAAGAPDARETSSASSATSSVSSPSSASTSPAASPHYVLVKEDGERVRNILRTCMRNHSGLGRNRYPHVTLSCAVEVKPKECNDMLRSAHRAGTRPNVPASPCIVVCRVGFVVTARQQLRYLLKLPHVLQYMGVSPDDLQAAL